MLVPELAPKITGMLIGLPVEKIKGYLVSFDALKIKVNEAVELIKLVKEKESKDD